jgi:hypothetical protein
MADLLDAAKEVDGYCRRHDWRFCIIGGMALLRWGEQRMTKDVDITLLTGFGDEERYIRALTAGFEPLVPNAIDFALRNRVLPVRTKAGFKANIALGALPFEEQAVTRATDYVFAEGVSLRVCSAEDLVVMKAFAARPQDWIDVEGILIRQCGQLDFAYIHANLEPLAELKDCPEIMTRLRALAQRHRASGA